MMRSPCALRLSAGLLGDPASMASARGAANPLQPLIIAMNVQLQRSLLFHRAITDGTENEGIARRRVTGRKEIEFLDT